jgi:ligand-binding sensor domain-containing protein
MQREKYGGVKWLFVMLQIFYSILCGAQQLKFRHLDDGPSESCYSILQDRKGYIWITSDKGIYKYDGTSFKLFDKDVNGKHLPSCFYSAEDAEGRITFNTIDCNIYILSNDSVRLAPLSKKLSTQLSHGWFQIWGIYIDKSNFLWIGGNGVQRSAKPGDYSDITPIAAPHGTDSCHYGTTIIDTKALAFVSSKSDWRMVNGKRIFGCYVNRGGKANCFQFKQKDVIQNGGPRTLLLNNGVVLFALLNQLFICYADGKTEVRSMQSAILSIYQDREGGIWICYLNKGVAYYPDAKFGSRPILFLNGNNVANVFEDLEGGIWATTLNNGLYYCSNKCITDYSSINGLNTNVSAICALNNKILVNNEKDFVSLVYNDTVKRMGLLHEDFQGVRDFCVVDDKVYVASVTGMFYVDTSMKGEPTFLASNIRYARSYSYNTACAPDKKIYAISATYEEIIKGDSIQKVIYLPGRGRCMCVTSKMEDYLGCNNGLYQRVNDKYIYLGNQDKFFENSINALKEDKKGNLWVGTLSAGLGIYANGRIKIVKTKANGLYSDVINDIAFDSMSNVWVATDKGLSRIEPKNNYAVESYDMRNGLISDNINKLTIRGNELWLGTKAGVCKIDMRTFQKNMTPPPVYITGIYVNDSISQGKADFSHTYNNFKFHMVGLTYKDNKTRFEYRLKGLDSTWHNTGFPEVQYNNLGPGRYRFEVKALNADGVRSKEAAFFGFKIEPPFWLRWWFIGIEILMGAGIVYLFIRLRLKAIEKREGEKTRINKMLAEYQMSALSAQMNPHFVFNAINSIQDYVLGNNPQQAYDYLTKFAQLVRMVLENAKEKTITLERELELLMKYIELEQLRFENKFEIKLDIGEEVDTYNIQIPSMIIQPYVENAIWHGLMPLSNERRGKIEISLTQEKNVLSIIVEDNGIGRAASREIRKSAKHKSVGMEITSNRIEVLNNLMESTSSDIKITDLHDDDKPTGTRVEIKLTINID